MTEYKELLKKLERAKKATSRAESKEAEAYNDVEEARGNLSIECNCGIVTQVKKIPFLKECVPGYSSWDDYDCSYKKTWICPGCGDEYYDLKTEEFPEGIKNYCKIVYEWQSYETQEVKDLRQGWRDRENKAESEREYQQQIEAAKRLLSKEGILSDQK